MPAEQEVYARHAAEYEALVSREDFQGNILKTIAGMVALDDLEVLDLGAGTGRLACLLQPLVRRVIACDASLHMLGIALHKLREVGNALVAAADHRYLPWQSRSTDLIVSGWSVSYVAVWAPQRWREEAEVWLAEARRVLRHGGHIILLESLGTGNEMPERLPHLENFYRWLDEAGFQSCWIRTDYRFESPEEAGRIAGFFFGEELKRRIERERLRILPECTGVWWLRV
ncbi:MAG: class I SAM-dependent methyltransferase [Anaerolineae bacterium]